MLLKNFFGHLHTVGRHRRLVRKYCFRLGLYRQGLMHDLSKYSPMEFIAGVKYYTGKKSPNAGERDKYGYSPAWIHHKGRNRHHFEYWTDYSGPDKEMVGVPMPTKYFCEMLCDRVAASRIYNGDSYTDAMPLEYFYRSKEYRLMHPTTYDKLEKLLKMLKDEGEDKTFEYVKKEILKKK